MLIIAITNAWEIMIGMPDLNQGAKYSARLSTPVSLVCGLWLGFFIHIPQLRRAEYPLVLVRLAIEPKLSGSTHAPQEHG